MNDIIRLERSPNQLHSEEFDLLITGAGIFGACAAWEAALRGYKVAVVEQSDFGGGASANSYKMVHGGIRYIQHLDIARVRGSCRERSALLRIAPHLVHPLPIAIPTYGYGMSGKPVLAAGSYLYDLVTADRNKGITDKARRIPWASLIDKDEILSRFPGIEQCGLTGAVLFSDAQMYNPSRLVLAFLQSAATKGAAICNYTKVVGFRMSGNNIGAAKVRDELSGETFEIRAKTYLNTAGPWTDALLGEEPQTSQVKQGTYSRDACFVVPRRFDHDSAIAVMGQTKDPDALMSRPARHLFVVPWRQYSLIGVWHKVVDPRPNEIGIQKAEIDSYIAEIHETYPDLDLSADEVTMCNWGLVPFGEIQKSGADLSYGKRSILIDHADQNGPSNMVSLIGIRYTMGRGDASWAMQSIARKLHDDRPAPRTHAIPLYGGDIEGIDSLVKKVRHALPDGLDHKIAYSLARNYGTKAIDLISSVDAAEHRALCDSHVLEAEIAHAVNNEMAQTLSDIVFRRTDLASGGSPGSAALQQCAGLAQDLLGLTKAEVDRQLKVVADRIPGWR